MQMRRVTESTIRWIIFPGIFFAAGLMLGVHPVAAGHTFGGGDCWRVGTPYTCRTSYSSTPNTMHLRIINQLNDSKLWSNTQQACANWESSPGPVYCLSSATSHDSWDYFKRDDTQGAPNGYTWNCVSGSCPAANPVNALWSEIYLTIGDDNYTNPQTGHSLIIAISAHEIGHSLGLAHHGTLGSNVALMTQGTYHESPTNIDLGPLPACSTVPVGSNGSGGVRCIYDAFY